MRVEGPKKFPPTPLKKFSPPGGEIIFFWSRASPTQFKGGGFWPVPFICLKKKFFKQF